MLADPATRGELSHHTAVQTAARPGVEILETGLRDTQARLLHAARQRAIVPKEVLGIDEHAEALVKAEALDGGIVLLREIGIGERAEAQAAEAIEGGRDHEGSPSW